MSLLDVFYSFSLSLPLYIIWSIYRVPTKEELYFGLAFIRYLIQDRLFSRVFTGTGVSDILFRKFRLVTFFFAEIESVRLWAGLRTVGSKIHLWSFLLSSLLYHQRLHLQFPGSQTSRRSLTFFSLPSRSASRLLSMSLYIVWRSTLDLVRPNGSHVVKDRYIKLKNLLGVIYFKGFPCGPTVKLRVAAKLSITVYALWSVTFHISSPLNSVELLFEIDSKAYEKLSAGSTCYLGKLNGLLASKPRLVIFVFHKMNFEAHESGPQAWKLKPSRD